MNRYKVYLIPFLLFLFSFLLRLSLISKGAYHLDCLHFAWKVEKTINTLQLHFLHSHGYPLTAILGAALHGVLRFFGLDDPVFAVNFLSVLLSSLCIPLLYVITNLFFNDETRLSGFFGALLFSLSPIFLGISVYGNSHTPSAFFMLCGILFTLKYFQSDEGKNVLWAGLFFGLMGAARLQDFVAVAPVLLILFLFFPSAQGWRARISSCGLSLSIAVCTVFLFYIPILLEPGVRSREIPMAAIFQNEVTRYLSWRFLSFFKMAFDSFLINLDLLGSFILLGGLIYLISDGRRLFILLCWILVPLFAFSLLSIIVPRFLTTSLLATYMIVGYFFAFFVQKNRFFKYATLAVFLVLASVTFQRIFPIILFRHQRALLPEFARWVADKTEDNARIIVSDNWLFINFYGKRETLNRPRLALRPIPQSEIDRFHRLLDSTLEQGYPVYITYNGIYHYNPLEQFSNFIHTYYELEYIGYSYSEDWHPGVLTNNVHADGLYRLKKKT